MLPLVKCISCRVSDSYSRVNLSSKICFWNQIFKINTLATGHFAPGQTQPGAPPLSNIFLFTKAFFLHRQKNCAGNERQNNIFKGVLNAVSIFSEILLLYNPIILNFRDLKDFETFWRLILYITSIFDGWL